MSHNAADQPFIVAEMSANHLGRLDYALEIVRQAALVGADAIKIQVWSPARMVAGDPIIAEGPWAGRRMAELYAEAHTPWEWVPEIFERAKELDIQAFASVFDPWALDWLEQHGCPMYKIASFELVDLPLIRDVAATGKRIVLSTGMATMDEINTAVTAARDAYESWLNFTVLKCTSAYPTPSHKANLAHIRRLQAMFGPHQVGISDHSTTTEIPALATAMGAVMIEKHLQLVEGHGRGPDGAFSLLPKQFALMVKAVEQTCEIIGANDPMRCEDEERPQLALRRSLYAACAINPGEKPAEDWFYTARPAHGAAPVMVQWFMRRTAKRPIAEGEPILQEDWE